MTLDTDAVLIADGRLVIGVGETGDTADGDGSRKRLTGKQALGRIVDRDVVKGHARGEGLVRADVINIVALDTFIHGSEAAANDGLVIAAEIVSETDARSEVKPKRP